MLASEPELAPDNTAVVLLKLAADKDCLTDLDDFLALVNTAVAYLQHIKFQKGLFQYGALDTTLTILVDSYTRFDGASPTVYLLSGTLSPDQDDAKLLSQMRSSFNQVLSDVSALPEFAIACPVVSPFACSLRRWLSSPQLQLQVCACIMLGNLARSDASCEEFVHTCQVHKPLITVLNSTNDSQLLHAALGFLKNLALPPKNKDALGETGLMDVLPRLWNLDNLQQIQYSSISLTRQLIIGNWENIRRICVRLSPDPDSPAHMHSNLSILIDIFARVDVEPTKMEIARLITALCRVFNALKTDNPEKLEANRKRFFEMHPGIGRPLGFMVSQNKWPVVRSEGWFVFALMARTPEGAQCISDLMHDVTVFQPLVEMLTGKSIVDGKPVSTPGSDLSSPKLPNGGIAIEGMTPEATNAPVQSAEMARIDRENALVLVSELLRNMGDSMAVVRRTVFQDLLKGGGRLVLTSQQVIRSEEVINRLSRGVRAGLNPQEDAVKSFNELS
jgi:hypothetical protein